MMIPSLVDLTSGMRCTLFCLLRSLGLFHAKPLQNLGIGSAEQSWSNVKTIKNGKRANIGGKTLEKRAMLYTSAELLEAQLMRNSDTSNDPD